MQHNPSIRFATLVAAALLVSCRDSEDPPAPLTRLVIPQEATAAVVLRPGPDRAGALYTVGADGRVERAAAVGEAAWIRMPDPGDPEGRWRTFRHPWPHQLVPLGERGFAIRFGGAEPSRDEPDTAYVKLAALAERDGTLTFLPYYDVRPTASIQADGAGRVYTACLEYSPDGCFRQEILPIRIEGGNATVDWRISAAGDRVTAFTLDGEGNLAYRADREAAASSTPIVALRPTVGPLAVWPDDGTIGSFWRGANGRMYVTRSLGDAAQTTELLRIDFGLATVGTPVNAWTGAPGALDGEPLALGEARAFVRANEVVVLETPSSAPAVHPLAFTHRDVRASAGALWLVAEDAGGAPTRAVRWAAGLAEDLLPADTYDVERLEPYGDGGALAGVIRRSDGTRLLLRVMADGTTEALDAGIPTPELVDGVLLP